jgi:hypothetical protein
VRGRPRLVHALLLLPLLAVGVWLAMQGRRLRDDPAAVLKALRSGSGPTLPAAAAVQATARTEPTSYDTKTIFDFIDGAAEAYLQRGFERCVASTFTFSKAGGGTFDISAEVYRFSTDKGAAEQLGAERPGDVTPVAGVPGAVADPTSLLAQRGRDYLKLTAMVDDPAARPVLERFAAAWQKEQT